MKRCLVSFAIVGVAVLSSASSAAAFTVTTTSDATSGACSLRVAIAAVAANTVGGDCTRTSGDNTITLPAGTYTLTSGTELRIASGPTVTVVGADPSHPEQTVIDAAGTLDIPRRVIEVDIGRGATLQNVEIKGGQTADGVDGVSAGQSGTFGADGGGILNNGALTLDHVLVTDNFTGKGGSGQNSAGDGHNSGSGAPGGSGGAIYNGTNASLSITASTIDGNGTGPGGNGGNGGNGAQGIGHFATGDDGGAGAYSGSGGGIFNLGNANINTSTISGNFTGVGGIGGSGGQGAGELGGPPGTASPAGNGGDGGRGGNGSWGVDPNLSANFQYLTKAGGGGIASSGSLTVTASTISGNNTGVGGLGGTAGVPGQNLDNSFRTSGLAGDGGSAGIGGGLLVDDNVNHTSQANLTNVTIAGNFTGNGGTGGAGYSGATGLGGGRGGYGGYGGGIWSIGANNSGPVTLTHVTIAQNGLGAAGAGGANDLTPTPGIRGQGAGVATGGRFNPSGSSVYFKNTLVAGNGVPGTDVNCLHYYAPPTYVDFGDLGHNLSFPDSSCPGINGDPLLGSLGPNGGPTDTMLPASGSAAIGVVPAASCSATDQRGNARLPSGDTVCDIGAVETGLAAPQLQLSVLKSGTGGGTVTSSPGGINCGATCAANFGTGQVVTLTATPTAGSTFSGWSGGGCGGTGQCAVTLNADTQVTATFTPSSTSSGGGGGPPAAPAGPTGQRAAALKKCKKKTGRARANCKKKAKKLPV